MVNEASALAGCLAERYRIECEWAGVQCQPFTSHTISNTGAQSL